MEPRTARLGRGGSAKSCLGPVEVCTGPTTGAHHKTGRALQRRCLVHLVCAVIEYQEPRGPREYRRYSLLSIYVHFASPKDSVRAMHCVWDMLTSNPTGRAPEAAPVGQFGAPTPPSQLCTRSCSTPSKHPRECTWLDKIDLISRDLVGERRVLCSEGHGSYFAPFARPTRTYLVCRSEGPP